MNRIKLITEAYSMQPITLQVHETEPEDSLKHLYIKNIVYEQHSEFINGRYSEVAYYVGYDWNNRIAWKYHTSSVNVHYFNS